MNGKHFKADMKDLRDSGKTAESAGRTVKEHVGSSHLRSAGQAISGSASQASLTDMAATWDKWAKSWSTTMQHYGESLQHAARDYTAHDDRYSKDFKTFSKESRLIRTPDRVTVICRTWLLDSKLFL